MLLGRREPADAIAKALGLQREVHFVPDPEEGEGYWEFAPPAPADQVGPNYWESVVDAVIREETKGKPS